MLLLACVLLLRLATILVQRMYYDDSLIDITSVTFGKHARNEIFDK